MQLYLCMENGSSNIVTLAKCSLNEENFKVLVFCVVGDDGCEGLQM